MHLPETLKKMFSGNPDVCLLLLMVLTWKITSIAVKPKAFILAVLLTAFLVAYAYRVLGRNRWLPRFGWVRPTRRFWLYAAVAGALAAFAVSAIARLFHVRLATYPRHTILMASTSAAMLEELFFRGYLFWLILEKLLLPLRFSTILARTVTVLVTACLFAFAHKYAGLSLYTTIGTGIAYGCMRLASRSTAATAVMHGVFNFVLALLAMR